MFASVFFVSVLIHYSQSSCLYDRYDKEMSPIFIRSIDNKHKIFGSRGRPIVLTEDSFLLAQCTRNFTSPIFNQVGEDSEVYTKIQIRCHNGTVFYQTVSDESNNDEIPAIFKRSDSANQPMLRCSENQIGLYDGRAPYCNEKTVIVFALNVDYRNQIQFGDICYDYDRSETVLVHYGTNENSFTLESPAEYAHPDIRFYPSRRIFTDFISSIENRTFELNEYFQRKIPKVFENRQVYRFDELVPSVNLLNDFTIQSGMLATNSIPWWTNLKDGNWKIVEKVVEDFVSNHVYDVYTGILHYDSSRPGFLKGIQKYLHYSLQTGHGRVPMYVWKYIKPRLPDDSNEEVVIVGVNYPFKETDLAHLNFCRTNIWHTVPWLQRLQGMMLADGLIFFCNTDEARQYISVIEKIQYSFRNSFTVEERMEP